MRLSNWYKPFFKIKFGIIHLFGLFPPIDDENVVTCGKKRPILKKSYSILLTFFFLSGYTFLRLIGTTITYKNVRMSSKILNILVDTALTMICIISVLGNAFWNNEKYSHYLKLQNILKNKMNVKMDRRKKYVVLSEFLLGHITFLVVVAVDQYK